MTAEEEYKARMEKMRERMRNRVECQHCKFGQVHETFTLCMNEEGEFYTQPCRNTASCICGRKKD